MSLQAERRSVDPVYSERLGWCCRCVYEFHLDIVFKSWTPRQRPQRNAVTSGQFSASHEPGHAKNLARIGPMEFDNGQINQALTRFDFSQNTENQYHTTRTHKITPFAPG